MRRPIKVDVVGDFDPMSPTHPATNAALEHSATALGAEVMVRWHPTDSLLGSDLSRISAGDALWCAPGSPYKSLDGALRAIKYAREMDVPLLGTCGGFQHIVIEYARDVLGFEDAAHAEYDPNASTLFISELSCSLGGKTMVVKLAERSRAARLYGSTQVLERYYCNFGLNPDHRRSLHDRGLQVVGVDQDGEARVLELADHRFYVATLFVPQLTSSPSTPHPLITGYLRAAMEAAEDLDSPVAQIPSG